MAEERFVIRRTFLFPLGLLVLLCLALLATCIMQGEPKGKVIILAAIIIPALVLFLESAFRKVRVAPQEVTVDKFLRRKSLRLSEISSVDTVQVRRRVFLTLSAGDDFVILSNAFANFPALVSSLLAKVPPATVSEETQRMATAPPTKSADIFSCWLAVVLVALILFVQLGGSF